MKQKVVAEPNAGANPAVGGTADADRCSTEVMRGSRILALLLLKIRLRISRGRFADQHSRSQWTYTMVREVVTSGGNLPAAEEAVAIRDDGHC